MLKGNLGRSRIIQRAKEAIIRQHDYVASCTDVLVNDVERQIFLHHTKDAQIKNFNTLPDETIVIGSVVVLNGTYWLVTKIDYDNKVTQFGEISQCNRELVWQNSYTKEIVRRWCTIDKPYYSNLEVERPIETSNREFKIQIPFDEETSLLDLNKRFILENIGASPKTYRVTSPDQNTERYVTADGIQGFLVLNVTQDQWRPETDNIELGICDYIEPIPPSPIGEKYVEVIPKNKQDNIVQIGGLPTILMAIYFDEDGTELITDSTWSLMVQTGFESKYTLTQSGSECRIFADDTNTLLGQTLQLTVSNSEYGITKTIELKVVV